MAKLKGVIFERLYPINGGADRGLCFGDYFYYKIQADTCSPIRSPKATGSTACTSHYLWINDKHGGKTHIVDLNDPAKAFEPVPYLLMHIIKTGNRVVADTFDDQLVAFDFNKRDYQVKQFEKNKSLIIAADEASIYTRTDDKRRITCYHHNLEPKWAYDKLEEDVYTGYPQLQLHNDLLILNHNKDTLALNRHTGELVWRRSFEANPTSAKLVEGKIYIVCQAILYILDPDTGEVSLQVDTGYPVIFPGTADNLVPEPNTIGIYPLGDYLYGVAEIGSEQYKGNLRLYSKDGSEILDHVILPDYFFNFGGQIEPVVHNNKIYHYVRNGFAFASSGTMVLEVSGSPDAEVVIEPRPPVIMQASPSMKVPHKLQIFLALDNLPDTLRYGHLYTRELIYATGYYGLYNIRKNARDKKHNGEVELIVDDSAFKGADADTYLSRLEEDLADNMCLAGDKKTKMRFTLIRQPESDWDLSGEALDWPALRAQANG